MIRMSKATFIVLGVIGAFQAKAQDTMRLVMQSAQDIALSRSIDVQFTEMDAEILRLEANEVMTEGFPKLNANVDYNWNFQQQVNVIPENSFFIIQPTLE